MHDLVILADHPKRKAFRPAPVKILDFGTHRKNVRQMRNYADISGYKQDFRQRTTHRGRDGGSCDAKGLIARKCSLHYFLRIAT